MQDRYAIYYAPETGSELDLFGKLWLGRNTESDIRFEQPQVRGFDKHELLSMTSSPRHYGFHGTLVPPFRLSANTSKDFLFEHARQLATRLSSFDIHGLMLKKIGRFIALVPTHQEEIAKLASTCVRSFHPLRKQPSLLELERRRSKGLTPRQDQLLVRWGYPYVMEEFRFHMTLSNAIPNSDKLQKLVDGLTSLCAPFSNANHPVRELCIFHQQDENSPFQLIDRIPFQRETGE